ncbi:hypothetical protein WA158_008107 [Blastocystis sp. Blastoise]
MSTTEFRLTEDKYLFTFQDESQIWISKEFIEKYQQLQFYNIIEHSEKYDDGTYYVDMPPFHMNKVIHFLMQDNMDVFSLNLKDSYDIYKTLIEYSVTIDNEIQSDLLYHVKDIFYKYLKDNNYDIYYSYTIESCMPMELFNLERKAICSNGLITSQRKDELLYYSLLIKMMNITKVVIIYDYSSNIPLEYIYPSCIKDIFTSLKELKIIVTTHYNKTELLLNPNSDEYIMEYNRLFYKYDYEIENPEEYEYYNESEMNEYNKISCLDHNKLYYSHDLINSYNEKRDKNELPKLYKYIVNEAIYTKEYSNVETNEEEEDEYTLDDIVIIDYDTKTNDKRFIIDEVYTKHGISQLLLLPSYMCISKIILNEYLYDKIDPMCFIKLFEEGVFDSLTILSIDWIKSLTNKIDENLYNKIMITHIFPNVTELIYDDEDDNDNDSDDNDDDDDDEDEDDNDNDESFQLSSIKKECFPKLHIINYDIYITTKNFKSLFPDYLMSMIDTIHINKIDSYEKEEIVLRLDEIVYTHSIHININNDFICYLPHLKELLAKNLISIDYLSLDSSRSANIDLFESIENNKQNIDCLYIEFRDDKDNEDDVRNALERFLNTDILKHLNYLYVSFDDDISIEYITWISTIFNDNTFNTIHKLEIDLSSMEEDSSSEYLTIYENIVEKLIFKASIVTISNSFMTFINRLIPTGCFHRTTQLNLDIDDTPDDNFCKLYTTDNFPQLKSIKFYERYNIEQWLDFIKTFCRYMNNNNFLSSSIVRLGVYEDDNYDDYIYDPNNSILRCKYDSNSFINTIIGTQNATMSKYEIETLLECINENKTQNIKSLALYIYDDEQLSKLTKCITTGKFPKLKALNFCLDDDISSEQANICKQQLKDSSFIQENHVYYKFY